jgi:tetratricopeptide (TPR) repeat protein
MDANQVLLVEKALLRGQWDSLISEGASPAVDLAKLVVECRFRDALASETAKTLFRQLSENVDQPFRELLGGSVRGEGDQVEEELSHLSIAVACFHAFIQANWTGPDLDIEPLQVVMGEADTSRWTPDALHAKAIAELAYLGEPAYHLAKVPAFLRFSQILLCLPYQHLESITWWRLRVATVHQQILDEPVALPQDFQSLERLTSTLACEPDLAGRVFLEFGLLEHHVSRDKYAGELFVKASRSTGLEYELTGALGKRTKFQQAELSQLVLLAESQLQDSASSQKEKSDTQVKNANPAMASQNIPETLTLNDDTLLEQTEFTSSKPAGSGSQQRLSHIDPSAQPPLHPLDQCILLSLCLNVRNTSPLHGLTTEQMTPYVARVISHPRNWSVHTMALLLRSRLESSRTRTVERSTLQLQALIDQMPTSDSSTSERLLYFHSIPLPSRWEMEKELAERFLSLGVVKSALEIFERLEMWEEVVKCYGALEQPEKGIAIVRDLLEGRKEDAEAVISRGKSTSTPRKVLQDTTREAKLWCLLGDLDPANAAEHYNHAWQLSNETSGRAMRSLGGYYFARAKYPEAITCLKRAVKINPLLTRSWFILGCACMRVEDWEAAKDAFSRCVSIDEEDGESWNNLASMYLRIGTNKAPKTNEESSSSSQVRGTFHFISSFLLKLETILSQTLGRQSFNIFRAPRGSFDCGPIRKQDARIPRA